jgi:hypothetical protein
MLETLIAKQVASAAPNLDNYVVSGIFQQGAFFLDKAGYSNND